MSDTEGTCDVLKNFVVLAMAIRETAVIPATTSEEAISLYEKPDDDAFDDDEDIILWAVPEEEFKELLEAAK